MASTVKTFTSTGTWVCPPGVTAVKVEIRAPGGGSGGLTTDTFAIGGAAGGQYVIKNAFTVTPGTTYTVHIGAVGAAGSATGPTNGGDGGVTWFSSNDASGVVAQGGAHSNGNSRTGGVGATTGGVGDTVRKGGNGGTSTGTTGGGGGEGGCSDKDGGSGGAPTAGSGGDGGDGGTGASNGVGGAPSNYGGGGAGSASTGTTNRAGRAGAAGNMVLTYTTPLVSALIDNFDDNSIDLTKWESYVISSATIAETGGHVLATPANSTADSESGYRSIENYDLTGVGTFVKVVQTGDVASTFTVLQLKLDTNNYLEIGIRSSPSSNTLYSMYRLDPTRTDVATSAYDSAIHKYIKIREASGTLYYDYSTDGISWSNLGSVANPFAVTALSQVIFCNEDSSDASPGAAIFDDFNVAGTAISTVKNLAALGVG